MEPKKIKIREAVLPQGDRAGEREGVGDVLNANKAHNTKNIFKFHLRYIITSEHVTHLILWLSSSVFGENDNSFNKI